jgi:hypothetical protein
MPTMKSVQTAGPGKIEVGGRVRRRAHRARNGDLTETARAGHVAVADVIPERLPTALWDVGAMLRSEMTIIAAQGYPTEIFEVTPQIANYQQRFSAPIRPHSRPLLSGDSRAGRRSPRRRHRRSRPRRTGAPARARARRDGWRGGQGYGWNIPREPEPAGTAVGDSARQGQ